MATYASPLDHAYLGDFISDLHHNRLIDEICRKFRLTAGSTVLEIGVGSGRFTERLLARGLKVIATEPDPVLFNKLQQELGNNPLLSAAQVDVLSCAPLLARAELVCGFHVLHHIDQSSLDRFGVILRERAAKDKHFKGWFFLEPNPLNPLYFLQIALHPAMRWREEIGIWTNDLRSLGIRTRRVSLGTVGLFPPRPFVCRLPAKIQCWCTRLKNGSSLVRAYSMYGEVLDNG
jgi:SAM-dependent methyltransferase